MKRQAKMQVNAQAKKQIATQEDSIALPYLMIGFLVILLFTTMTFVGNSNASANQTANTTRSVTETAMTFQQEMNLTSRYGFNLNSSTFVASSAAQCTLVLIGPCNNNVPSQFICVASQYASQVKSEQAGLVSRPPACPQFFMSGIVSCAVQGNSCVVVDNNTVSITPANGTT